MFYIISYFYWYDGLNIAKQKIKKTRVKDTSFFTLSHKTTPKLWKSVQRDNLDESLASSSTTKYALHNLTDLTIFLMRYSISLA